MLIYFDAVTEQLDMPEFNPGSSDVKEEMKELFGGETVTWDLVVYFIAKMILGDRELNQQVIYGAWDILQDLYEGEPFQDVNDVESQGVSFYIDFWEKIENLSMVVSTEELEEIQERLKTVLITFLQIDGFHDWLNEIAEEKVSVLSNKNLNQLEEEHADEDEQ